MNSAPPETGVPRADPASAARAARVPHAVRCAAAGARDADRIRLRARGARDLSRLPPAGASPSPDAAAPTAVAAAVAPRPDRAPSAIAAAAARGPAPGGTAAAGRLRALHDLRRRGGKALVPYVMLGDPDLETSVACVRAMAAAGADAVELGIPFSDPLADGPVIQAAGQRALRGGFRVIDTFAVLRRLRAELDLPLCVMTYVNPVWQKGYAAFAAEAAAAGADALVVPDLPLEESAALGADCRRVGMDLVLFVAPTSTEARMAAVGRAASGFVYCVSVAGVTGPRADALARVPATVARARRYTDLPLLVGFGIDGPDKAAAAAAVADGVIVASWIVRALAELGAGAAPAERAAVAGSMVAALRRVLPR